MIILCTVSIFSPVEAGLWPSFTLSVFKRCGSITFNFNRSTAGGIIGQFFFIKAVSEALPLNGDRYQNMIIQFFVQISRYGCRHVVSTKRCHKQYSSRNNSLTAWVSSCSPNFPLWWSQLAAQVMRSDALFSKGFFKVRDLCKQTQDHPGFEGGNWELYQPHPDYIHAKLSMKFHKSLRMCHT